MLQEFIRLVVEASFHEQRFGDGTGEWNVRDIWDLAQRMTHVVSIPVARLANNLDPEEGSHADETTGSHEFIVRAQRADTSYPILVVSYPNELWVADGVHRLWRATSEGRRTIRGYVIPRSALDTIPQADETTPDMCRAWPC